VKTSTIVLLESERIVSELESGHVSSGKDCLKSLMPAELEELVSKLVWTEFLLCNSSGLQ